MFESPNFLCTSSPIITISPSLGTKGKVLYGHLVSFSFRGGDSMYVLKLRTDNLGLWLVFVGHLLIVSVSG